MARRFLTEEERALWLAANQETIPLEKKTLAEEASHFPRNRMNHRAPKHDTTLLKVPKQEGPFQEKSFHPIDRKTSRRIRRGSLQIDAKLDLHGLFQDEAYQRLYIFIARAIQRKYRLLLIITGKGKQEAEYASGRGVLKKMVPQWLSNQDAFPHVRSMETAHLRDGGEGAFYVFLKV